jgi:hypothetical protein
MQGFALANNTDKSIYDFFEANPEKATHFAGAMKALTSSPEYDVSHVLDNYDWASLGDAFVVDVGGSRGNVAVELAKRFDGLKILVQDMDKVIRGAETDIPERVRHRVSFMAHDIFKPQTVQADVYNLRWVLHNWPDKYW